MSPFSSSAKEVLHQPSKVLEVFYSVDGLTEGREIRQEFREVTARPGQPPQGQLRAVQPKLPLDQLEQHAATFRTGRRACSACPLHESTSLLEDPRVSQTAPANRHAIRSRLLQKADRGDRF